MALSPSVPCVEPCTFFIVFYYANTQQNTPPETIYPLLNTYALALDVANAKVVSEAGGACLIQQLDMTYVGLPHLLDVS